MLRITKRISIDEKSLAFVYSRSSGPGGQNVNKLNTKVTVLFNVENCIGLEESDKELILKKLSKRINKDGLVQVVCQQNRTQKANQKQAIEKLLSLIKEVLKPKPVRKKTKIPRWAKENRLKIKKKQSLKKQERAKNITDY